MSQTAYKPKQNELSLEICKLVKEEKGNVYYIIFQATNLTQRIKPLNSKPSLNIKPI